MKVENINFWKVIGCGDNVERRFCGGAVVSTIIFLLFAQAIGFAQVTLSSNPGPRTEAGTSYYCAGDEPTITTQEQPLEPSTDCCAGPTLIETHYEWEGMLKSHSDQSSQVLGTASLADSRNADVQCKVTWKWQCDDGSTAETSSTGTFDAFIVAHDDSPCTPTLTPANPVPVPGSGSFTDEWCGNVGVDPATGNVWSKFFTGTMTNLKANESLSPDGNIQVGTSCGGNWTPASHGHSGSVSVSFRVWGFLSVGGTKSFTALNPGQISGIQFKRPYYQAFRQTLAPSVADLQGSTYEQLTNNMGVPYGSQQNSQSVNGPETAVGASEQAGYAGKECRSDCCPGNET